MHLQGTLGLLTNTGLTLGVHQIYFVDSDLEEQGLRFA